mgnify:FL=1
MKTKGISKDFVKSNVIYIVFAVMLVGLSIFSESFLSITNITNILRQSSLVGIVALGMTYIMIAGGIDLSVGSTIALAACVSASLSTTMGTVLPLPVALLAGVLVGVLVGIINGYVVAYLGIVPFITTLGMQSIVRGVALVYTSGKPINALTDSYVAIGKSSLFGIPTPAIIFMLLAIITWFFLSKTKYGRYLYAIGGNEEAATVAGLKVKFLKASTYVVGGALAAVAGIVLSARIAAGAPTSGEMYDFYAIEAVVIGGTSNQGGTGGIIQTIIGVLIIGVLNNGMDLLNISGYYQKIVTGLVVVLAVIIDRNNINRNH